MIMIPPLVIDKTSKIPQIIFDPDSDTYEISGKSLPENVVKEYEPVLQWIDDYIGIIDKPIIFNFKIDYLNSASAKMVSLILSKLEDFYKSGIDIKVNWHYYEDDDDIQTEGEVYAKLKKIPINLICIEED